MSQSYIEAKATLDAFDGLLSVQKELNPLENGLSNEIIYGSARLMQDSLTSMAEFGTFVDQVQILCQVVNSRRKMKDLGLDGTVMDCIVNAILQGLRIKIEEEIKLSTLLMMDRMITNHADIVLVML